MGHGIDQFPGGHDVEAIENIPKGYRARETYIQVSPNEVEEIFEMAEPNQDFKVYSHTRLKRVK